MLELLVKDSGVREGIERAGFAPVLQGLEAYLRSRGYAERTVDFYEQGAVHFALWLVGKGVRPSEITDDHTTRFLSHHLVNCRCPLAGVRQHQTVRAALRHFKVVLDAGGYRLLPREEDRSHVDRAIHRFDEHLRTTCGLREATRKCRRRYVREFLQELFSTGPVEGWQLTPPDVIQFVTRRVSHLKPGSAQVVASSLRSYFRYLRLCGECDEALVNSVPTTANHKLGYLPEVLTDDEVDRLLRAFDRRTATGRRDYAITRCLIGLALRAGEVAGLGLDDIDWRKGTLRIVGGKSRRDDELPLPASVGSAIAAYLRRGRPETSERRVFVRVRPPLGHGVTPGIIRNVVLRAASRAGLSAVITGTRILRHTVATRMLRHGASLKEVADVLRHRCLDTTSIYTKVDLPRLAAVAAPWPEDRR